MKWVVISALVVTAATSTQRDLSAKARRANAEGFSRAQPQPHTRVVILGTGTPNADPDRYGKLKFEV